MRPSPVAPEPTGSQKASNTDGLPPLTSKSYTRKHRVVATKVETAGSSKKISLVKKHVKTTEGFSNDDSSLLASATSSVPVEKDTYDNMNPATSHGDGDSEYPDYKDDLSQPSIDDPYTYSDDSASLSDAYFLRQPSPDGSVATLNAGHFGSFPLPIVPLNHYGDDRIDSRLAWSDPPIIHTNDAMLRSSDEMVSDHHASGIATSESDNSTKRMSCKEDRRREKRLQKRHAQSTHKRQGNPALPSHTVVEEFSITEKTALLRLNNRSLVRPVYNRRVKSFANSDAHRRHRQKHELRKHQRNILLQQQQERQEQREREVLEIRGKVQPLSSKKDRFWSFLFLLQLFFVFLCAIKDGLIFYQSSGTKGLLEDLTSVIQPSFPLASLSTIASTTGTSSVEINPEAGSSTLVMLDFDDDRDDDIDAAKLAAFNENESDNGIDGAFTFDYKNVLSLLAISGMYACVTSYLSFALMLIMARSIIPIMLVFTILLMLCWGVFGLTIDTTAGSMISLGGFAVFGMSFAYTTANWNHIPFCSTNLFAAICAMRSSIGMLVMGISSLFVGLLWLLIWTVALMGIFNRNNYVDCEIFGACETHVYISKDDRIIEVGLLLLSLYWTTTVIENMVRVAVAGAIGGPWWFGLEVENSGTDDAANQAQQQPSEENDHSIPYSSSIVSDPLMRACTSSFGTICFGSLVDRPAQMISKVVGCLCWITDCLVDGDGSSPGYGLETNRYPSTTSLARGSESDKALGDEEDVVGSGGDEGEMTGSATTKESGYVTAFRAHINRLDRAMRSYNRWSYVYIGMYNYSFCEGGEKAIQLFETREWMDIACDNLIHNILFMTSIVIGGLTGIVSVVVEEVDGYEFTSLHKPIVTSFLIGFFLGSILSNILLLGLVGGAVNTILVCFAAEPFEFDRIHPHLSREMREVWSQQVWEPEGGDD